MIRSNRQKKRILFVEDHDDAWEIVELALEESKLTFVCAFDDGLRLARPLHQQRTPRAALFLSVRETNKRDEAKGDCE